MLQLILTRLVKDGANTRHTWVATPADWATNCSYFTCFKCLECLESRVWLPSASPVSWQTDNTWEQLEFYTASTEPNWAWQSWREAAVAVSYTLTVYQIINDAERSATFVITPENTTEALNKQFIFHWTHRRTQHKHKQGSSWTSFWA